MAKLLKPKSLSIGDTIGIFTPSYPAYILNEEKFQLGIKVIQDLGFKVKLGSLTDQRANEGYRPASGKARADEFMALYRDPDVRCLIATLGGMNSNSMIPYLDFEYIRNNPKIVCGYSDVTSLHLSILHYSGLSTFYGPAIMSWFSEWPKGELETIESFLSAVSKDTVYPRDLTPFDKWSNHFRDWSDGSWKTQKRKWENNSGWKVLSTGDVTGEIVVCNLNTLISAAGTEYFPNVKNRILLIEEMAAPYSKEERSLTQLKLMGVFDEISGLIIGKPEVPNSENAPFDMNELIMEIVGKRDYPIVSEFDLSHTCPMHTLAQLSKVQLIAKGNYDVTFKILERMTLD
ncbi:S66 peptidase family protein [Halobacteriovorax sp. HLS]|uniref:S66 family peptidase n=1 Tax=Halobacteriovorax sp. HLS TaxID=2234000 RepID=UPI000FD713DF|nr:S66 peptidase family protein [Halobacteriovorax sp. HLS]